uniref:Serine/threonine protein kinase n=1 Tax=Cyanothece sp. (strain PCC 7425 / ATCC 29141) TaxID=395961 RepID=B8HRZ2_CYAP4
MSGSSADPNLGQLLISRYQLVELIGKGSMGRVYRAVDTLLGGVPVAVKFLSQTLLNEKMKMRFAQEARAGALLGQRSIHVVRVHDYGVNAEEIPFYVMEYLRGESLSDMLLEAPIPLTQFLRLIRHVCLGLETAHEGITIDGQICPIIHRDIKPSNVLVIQDAGLGELAKVLDFGIAKFMSDRADGGQTQSFMGTLAYCSPEQIEGRELDNRSDIYSLGVTMFEMLTTKMPIQAETHSIGAWFKAHHFQQPCSFETAWPGLNLPSPLEDLVMSCLAKSPADRPQSIKEILETLQPLEERYGPHRSTDHPAPETPSSSAPSLSAPQTAILSVEESCWQSVWPKDKPLGEIVFAKKIKAQPETGVGLWVMLPRTEIQKRLLNTRYNQFLFTMTPHPMILWITAIYDPDQGARWMPCYLDMKNPNNQELTLLLGQSGYYPLLFFALEDPQHCANVMTLTIAPYQRQLLQQWVQTSRSLTSSASPTVSKGVLKTELEKLKPQVLQKLQLAKTRIFLE